MSALESTKRRAMYRATSKVAIAVCVAVMTLLLRNLYSNALVVDDRSFDTRQNESESERIAVMSSHRSWSWSTWKSLTTLVKSQVPRAVMVEKRGSNTTGKPDLGRTRGDLLTGQSDDVEPTIKTTEMGALRDQLPREKRSLGSHQDTGSLRRRGIFLEQLRAYQVSLVPVVKDPTLGNPLFTSSLKTYMTTTGIAIQTDLLGNPVGFISGLRTYLGGAPTTILGTDPLGNPVGFISGLRTYLGGVSTTTAVVKVTEIGNPVAFISGLRTYLLGGASPTNTVTTVARTGNSVTFISGLRSYFLGGVLPTTSVEIVTGTRIKFISGLRSLFGGQPILEETGIIKLDADSQTDPTRQKPSQTDAKSLPTADPGSSDDDGGSFTSSGQSSSINPDTGDGFSITSNQGRQKSGGKTGKPSTRDPTVPSGSIDDPDTNLADPSDVSQPINPVSTGNVSRPGSKGVVNQPVSTQNPNVSSGSAIDTDTGVEDASVVTQSTTSTTISTDSASQTGLAGGVSQPVSSQNPTVVSSPSTDNPVTASPVADPSALTQPTTPVSTGGVSQPGSAGRAKQSVSTQNSTVSSGSTDTLDTTSTVTNPSVVTQPETPGSTSGASQTFDTTSTSSVTTQGSLSISELLAIIQTLLAIISGKTPNSRDALAQVTSQLSKVSFNTSTSETQLPNTTTLQNNVIDNNPSEDSSSPGVGVQELKQTVVVEAAPSDPGSSSPDLSSSDIKTNTLLSGEPNGSSDSSSLGSSDVASSDLTTKDSSSGTSSDSSSVTSSDQQLQVLRARNIASGETKPSQTSLFLTPLNVYGAHDSPGKPNGSPHSSSVDLTDTVVEDTAQYNRGAPPILASTMGISPAGVSSNEPPCSSITGVLESSDLLDKLVPTMSSNSESGTLYGLSLKSAPKNIFYNLGLLESERSKELKVSDKSFLKVFVN